MTDRSTFSRVKAPLSFVMMLALAVGIMNTLGDAGASPAQQYSGTHFGDGNLPDGCITDMSATNPDNICHHMRTGLNALDSPQIDVLVAVPVSPTAERDLRVMRQAVEMWEGGIDYLAPQMGMEWLGEGVDFHITVDYVDLENGGEFTTYPIVDPEIVVLGVNPVGFGKFGIGIDPVANFAEIIGEPAVTDIVPCTGIENPFDMGTWESMPGFNSHHDGRSGTYNEDCGGSGGNICFAINTTTDTAVAGDDDFNLFDLVAHEVGHCLTVGHVGDGAEGTWGALPPNDIMAYDADPPGLNKCVSTLDVEGFALTMSELLDVDGDGAVTEADHLEANDVAGDGRNAFQIQHPADHLYASPTGDPMDCPQPDEGPLPGTRTQWNPEAIEEHFGDLTLVSPTDADTSSSGAITVSGSLDRAIETHPSSVVVDDADDDASSQLTEILEFSTEVTDEDIVTVLSLADLWPSTDAASATSYSVSINGRQFDSFVRYAIDPNPMTWDNGASTYMPTGTSTWDLEAKTVTFTIPLAYLDGVENLAPYEVSTHANVGLLTTASEDDRAPELANRVVVASAAASASLELVGPSANTEVVTFEHDGPSGNTFYTENSTLGVPPFLLGDQAHIHTLDLPFVSDVVFTLTWTDEVGGADLDLYVTGAGVDSGTQGATTEVVETVVVTGVQGHLDLRVEPYLVTDPIEGATYTLTAEITNDATGTDTDGDGVADSVDRCPDQGGQVTSDGCPDRDGDDVDDLADECPDHAGLKVNGCPTRTEHVVVFVDGQIVADPVVDTLTTGSDTFAIDLQLAPGTHDIRVEWQERGIQIDAATVTVNVIEDADGDGVPDDVDQCPGFDDHEDADGDGVPDDCDPDRDGDEVIDTVDNCRSIANNDQSDIDGDGRGDVCDPDADGDGHANGKEQAHETDPFDPTSFPTKGGA